MTEAEWQVSTDPVTILKFLRAKDSDRKLRLFGLACCRRISHLLFDERLRRAVDVGELLADGLMTETEAEAAGNATAEAASEVRGVPEVVRWRAAMAAQYLLPRPEESWLLHMVWELVAVAMEGEQLVKEGATPEMVDAWSEQIDRPGRTTLGWTAINPDAIIADILREILGPLPFRRASIEPTMLRWNDGIVVKLAEGMYEDRSFDHLPILADALEEAGCTDADILAHCRQPGQHVRGCWVVDLLLGKESCRDRG
jgi:hypothetical protein